MPPARGHDVDVLTLRLHVEVVAAIRRLCAESGATQTKLVEILLREALAARGVAVGKPPRKARR